MNKTRKRILTDYTDPADIGKLPPQAVDMEEAVLGAMLLEKEAVETVINIIKPESFYKEQNARICTAIFTLYKANEPIDILTVTKELNRTGDLEHVGGAYYVSLLTNRVASSANIEYHARVVVQQAMKRDIIRISTQAIQKAYDPSTDVFDLYQEHSSSIDQSLSGNIKFEPERVGTIHAKIIEDGIKTIESGLPSGVPTGLRAVDKVTSGWQKSDLIIIAGRPGMGKTAVARAFVIKPALEQNIPTAMFTLEVSKTQFVNGLQAYLSEINFGKIVKQQYNRDELNDMAGDAHVLFDTPIYVDDTPAISLIELKAKLRRLVQVYGVKLAVIDYLQLMTSGEADGNREQEIARISRGLKALAKELDIPIIALSQLSRQVENRGGGTKRPQLSDLRESGAIEQDADSVMFVFRPEYYEEFKNQPYDVDGQQFNIEGLLLLIIAKHRAGDLGNLILGFVKEQAKVTNWDVQRGGPEIVVRYAKNDSSPNNLDKSKNNYIFVQDEAKAPKPLSINKDFLSQNSEQSPDDLPF